MRASHRCVPRYLWRLVGLFCLGLIPSLLGAAPAPPELCITAARTAAQQTGVPFDVLMAISLTETGRNMNGQMTVWPWTVNMEGAGHWFDTADDARAYVYEHFKLGARSFDVGCFQINYKWHHQEFESLDQMFDPLAGALYAARFLTDLKAETGSWETAAGAYHSRTPEHAERYMATFSDYREGIEEVPFMTAAVAEAPPVIPMDVPVPEPRVNSFPFFRKSGDTAGSNGSLVPLGSRGSTGRLIDFNAAEG